MFSFLLLSALLISMGRGEEEVDETDVLVLGADNFDATLADNEFVLVEFYAPWCGHCKRLVPEYAKAATALKASGVVLGKVDATVEADLAGKFDVRGYPTLKWFRSGKPADYNGGRTEEEIVSWCQKKSGPPSKEMAAADVAAFVEGKAAVVGTFKSRESDEYKAFIELAKDGDMDDFVFADVVGAKNEIQLYTTFAAVQVVTGADAKAFILKNGYPLVDELPGAWERYSKTGLPLAILFVDPAADNKALLAEVTKAAEAAGDKVSFSFADGIRFKQQIERMGGDQEVVPQIAAMKLSGKANYPYTGELKAAALQAWAEGIADGSIEPTMKSEEPVADADQKPLCKLVGKDIQAALDDTERDTLIEVYAPWCGHCKSLQPILEELGEKYADVAGLRICQIDGTANDIAAFDVSGFPTIKFASGGKVQDYNGGRTAADFITFFEANSKHVSGSGEDAADADKDEL